MQSNDFLAIVYISGIFTIVALGVFSLSYFGANENVTANLIVNTPVANTSECKDTDGGINVTAPGAVTWGKPGKTKTARDYCLSGRDLAVYKSYKSREIAAAGFSDKNISILYEAYCAKNVMRTQDQICDDGTVCTDTPNGAACLPDPASFMDYSRFSLVADANREKALKEARALDGKYSRYWADISEQTYTDFDKNNYAGFQKYLDSRFDTQTESITEMYKLWYKYGIGYSDITLDKLLEEQKNVWNAQRNGNYSVDDTGILTIYGVQLEPIKDNANIASFGPLCPPMGIPINENSPRASAAIRLCDGKYAVTKTEQDYHSWSPKWVANLKKPNGDLKTDQEMDKEGVCKVFHIYHKTVHYGNLNFCGYCDGQPVAKTDSFFVVSEATSYSGGCYKPYRYVGLDEKVKWIRVYGDAIPVIRQFAGNYNYYLCHDIVTAPNPAAQQKNSAGKMTDYMIEKGENYTDTCNDFFGQNSWVTWANAGTVTSGNIPV